MVVECPCSVSTASEVAAGPSYCSLSVAAVAAAHLVAVELAAEQVVNGSPCLGHVREISLHLIHLLQKVK